MLGIGFFMIAAALYGTWLWWCGRLYTTRWYLRVMAHTWWIGFVAVLAGWIVTESGRQPWIVHGLMRTADATSPVQGGAVAITLLLFVLVYGVIFSAGIYYLNRLLVRGMDSPDNSEQRPGREAAVSEGVARATRGSGG
jgi:cytochrome d ubiquinol oxidase subunit I